MALNLKTIAGGLLLGLGLATTGSAGTISFLDIADGAGFTDSNGDLRIGGEADWNTIVGSGIGIRDITTGISVVGTATRSDGGTSALAYFDRNTAGLGVCSVLTSSGQCNPRPTMTMSAPSADRIMRVMARSRP